MSVTAKRCAQERLARLKARRGAEARRRAVTAMDEIQRALNERERRSLIFVSAVGIGLCLFYSTVSHQLPLREVTPFFAAMVLAPAMLTFVVAMFVLQKGRGLIFCGYVIVGILAALFFAYPHVLYWSLGAEDLSPAVMLKSIQVVFGPILIAFVALTFRPALTIAAAIAFVLLHGLNMWIVLSDPGTLLTDDTVAGLTGPELLLSRAFADWSLLMIASAVAIFSAVAARRTVRRAVMLERTNGHLRRYFSPDVAEQLAQSGEWTKQTAGTTREVVILFSDIVNFTAFSKDLPPNEIVALLADYRQHMVAEIFAHGGTLDKFIGDGILAVFGTFGPTTDTADRAFSTARDMFRALEQMNARRRAVGLPPLRHRVGLHAGPALVGNVEAAGRMEFTAVGEAVNVASRIEQAGKALGEGLLISAAVCAQLSDSSPCRSLGLVDLPGYAPVELYAVRDRASA